MLVSHSMEEIARNVDAASSCSTTRMMLMSGTPARGVRPRGGAGARSGLDVPQVTRVAMRAARAAGLPIDPSVYTVEELKAALLALRKGGSRMLKDITLGQYFPGDTLVHRLDPRTKLLAS